MEEAKVKTRVNVLAISEKDPKVSLGRRRVISVQKSLTEIQGKQNLKKAEVCLGVHQPDDPDGDKGVEGFYLFIEDRSELDKLILSLQLLRAEIYPNGPQL